MADFQLVIDGEAEDEDAFSDILHYVADMIAEGYKSGYNPYWTLIERDEEDE